MIETFLKSLQAAEYHARPWTFWVLRDAIDPVKLRQLLNEARAIKFEHVAASRFFDYYKPGHEVHELFTSPRVQEVISDRFGFSGTYSPRVTYDTPGKLLASHPDVATKTGTIQIYLTDRPLPGHGTVMFDKHDRPMFEVPFAPGVGYLFRRGNYTYHGVHKTTEDRYSILCPVFKHEDL